MTNISVPLSAYRHFPHFWNEKVCQLTTLCHGEKPLQMHLRLFSGRCTRLVNDIFVQVNGVRKIVKTFTDLIQKGPFAEGLDILNGERL